VAILVSPLKNLVGVDSVLSRYSCDRCAWQQRCLHDPALLLRRTKNPLRRTACGKLARITHEPIVEPILKPVYMVKGGRLPTNLSRQFSNQGWAWSSSRLPLCASGGVVFDRWYEHSLCILIRLLKRPMSECEISKALQVSNTQSRIWLQKLVGKSVSPKAKKYRKIEQSPQDGGNA
jgi:hypothetical protein